MRIKMLRGAKVAANEYGSATVFWPKDTKHEAAADWEKSLFVALIKAGTAAEILPDYEAKDAGPAPENKAIVPEENKGEWRAEHKGGGRWTVLNPDGEQVGGLYAKDEAHDLVAAKNAGG